MIFNNPNIVTNQISKQLANFLYPPGYDRTGFLGLAQPQSTTNAGLARFGPSPYNLNDPFVSYIFGGGDNYGSLSNRLPPLHMGFNSQQKAQHQQAVNTGLGTTVSTVANKANKAATEAVNNASQTVSNTVNTAQNAVQSIPSAISSLPAKTQITADTMLGGRASINGTQINQYLASVGSPLAGLGDFIYNTAVQNGIDPLTLLAIWKREHNLMLAKGVATEGNNPGDMVYTGGTYGETGQVPGTHGLTFAKFPDIKAGIRANAELLNRQYLAKGINTFRKLTNIYSSNAAGDSVTWGDEVANIAQQILNQLNSGQ